MTNRELADGAYAAMIAGVAGAKADLDQGLASAKEDLDQIVNVPPPPPIPPEKYAFRGIYCRDTEFDACYPGPFHVMNLTAMECAVFSGTTNIKARMDKLAAPDLGWSVLGSFTPSTAGGTFSISDANCIAIVKSVAGDASATPPIPPHPRNSHRYYIADEPDISHLSSTAPYQPTWTTAQQDANRASLLARRNLIHAADPAAIVCIADYRRQQLSPEPRNLSNGYLGGCGRPGGMWKDIVDEVWLTGYPSPSVDVETTRIPDQATWCDATGIPYIGVRSCHDNLVNRPAYPTPTQEAKQNAQWHATNEVGSMLYIWTDGTGAPNLSTDPAMQGFIGSLNELLK